MHQFGYDLAACGQNQVLCKKATIQCLSTCGGVDGSQYKHDFSTIVSLTELSQFVLGEAFDNAAAANCSVKNYKFFVPTFEGGDSFKTFAARNQVRSGMTAIDQRVCNANARSCGVVQDMLERSPGLAFVNGRFVHAKSLVAPSPPPSPAPPPRTFAYAPFPPSPPPPPVTPPPYYRARAATRTHARAAPWPDARPLLAPIAGRRAVHPAAAPRRLRARHEHGRGQGRRERGARQLCFCQADFG